MNDLLRALTGLTLLEPELLAAALLIPLGMLLKLRRRAPGVLFAPRPLLADPPLRSWRERLLPLPRILHVLALVLVAVALARPVTRVQLPRERAGIDLLLCIDVSSSMAAKDMDPQRTRLDVAKDAAGRFVADRADDRIGLVRFARYPDVLCPMTLDHDALGGILSGLERIEQDSPEDRTGIGSAVARAGQVLRNSEARSKVVILLTDGEENVATARSPDEIGPLQAAELCRRLGVRVYTIAAGIGKRDKDGKWVPLDTSQVERLAERTGGQFFAAEDADRVASVYARINELEKAEFAEPRFELRDRFLPFLIGAVALLLVALWLRSTVFEVLP